METTTNGFLGGRLQIEQPAQGYRAGIDPVLLAAACDAAPGQRVLDMGCGVGTALYCLAARVSGLELVGVERDPDVAALARANAIRNGISARIATADLAALPPELRQRGFDLVLANPPYFDRASSTPSATEHRESARGEVTPLADWVRVAARRLVPGGRFLLIQRIERLPDILTAATACLGSIAVVPLQPRVDRPARLFLLRAQKAGRATFRLNPPIVLHDGAQHLRDGDDYRPEISAVLRDGAALPIG